MKAITITAIVIISILLLSAGLVFAYQGDPTKKSPNYSEEKHNAIEKAIENQDYDTWYSLMTENNKHPRVVDVITKENFAEFVEVHKAVESGDMTKANELRKELGLGIGNFKNKNSYAKGIKQGLKKGYNKAQKSCNCSNS